MRVRARKETLVQEKNIPRRHDHGLRLRARAPKKQNTQGVIIRIPKGSAQKCEAAQISTPNGYMISYMVPQMPLISTFNDIMCIQECDSHRIYPPS